MNIGNLQRFFILLIIFSSSACNWLYAQNLTLNASQVSKVADKFLLLNQYGCNILIMTGSDEIKNVKPNHSIFE